MENSPWSGTFSSTMYGWLMVKGIINIENIDLSRDDYETPVTMKYTGGYRNGQSMTSTVRVKGDNMIVMFEGQTISFTIDTKGPNLIKGTYYCQTPLDRGVFEIHPGNQTESGCSIM